MEKTKKISFGRRKSGSRKSKVKLPGYDEFEIEFSIPSNDQMQGYQMMLIAGVHASDLELSGKTMRDLVVKCLKSWSLPEKCTEHNIRRMDDASVLTAILAEIINGASLEGNLRRDSGQSS